ncbi:MAG: hypothetical protein ACOCXP_04535 [Candidatus Dojkabacteria bacterium]
MKSRGLSETEIDQLIELLEGLDMDNINKRAFNAIAKRFVFTAIEVVAYRISASGDPEVLLTPRPDEPGEPWPGQLHYPGTIVRIADMDPNLDEPIAGDGEVHILFRKSLRRLEEKEFNAKLHNLNLICHEYRLTNRGPTLSYVFLAEISGDKHEGKFYNLNSLPNKLHPNHHRFTAMIKQYLGVE